MFRYDISIMSLFTRKKKKNQHFDISNINFEGIERFSKTS